MSRIVVTETSANTRTQRGLTNWMKHRHFYRDITNVLNLPVKLRILYSRIICKTIHLRLQKSSSTGRHQVSTKRHMVCVHAFFNVLPRIHFVSLCTFATWLVSFPLFGTFGSVLPTDGHSNGTSTPVGILLVNLGSPDEPTPNGLYSYLQGTVSRMCRFWFSQVCVLVNMNALCLFFLCSFIETAVDAGRKEQWS